MPLLFCRTAAPDAFSSSSYSYQACRRGLIDPKASLSFRLAAKDSDAVMHPAGKILRIPAVVVMPFIRPLFQHTCPEFWPKQRSAFSPSLLRLAHQQTAYSCRAISNRLCRTAVPQVWASTRTSVLCILRTTGGGCSPPPCV